MVASVYCDAPVRSIAILVDLIKGGTLEAQAAGGNSGKAYLVKEAKKKCVYPFHYANWYGWTLVTVNFPPGFSPPTLTEAGTSPTVRLFC